MNKLYTPPYSTLSLLEEPPSGDPNYFTLHIIARECNHLLERSLDTPHCLTLHQIEVELHLSGGFIEILGKLPLIFEEF